jgi:WD40 repeat protein
VFDACVRVCVCIRPHVNALLRSHINQVNILLPHPRDSRIVASVGLDGLVVLWDVMTGVWFSVVLSSLLCDRV